MLTLAILLNLCVAAGLFVMAAKYITAEPPLDYHADILSGIGITDELRLVLGALYKVMGGCFAALGAGLLVLTFFGVWNDLFWAKLTILVMSGIAGYFATTTAKTVEDKSNIRTPWRIAAALTTLALLAFVVSLF